MMKQKKFVRNIYGVSMMYDAVFFIVMVSISGAILIPALQSNIAIETSLETHREHIADEALNTFLVSRVDKFSYKVSGDIIDDIAGDLGIDNSSDGLYGSITNWLLAREQLHKTHATLLAENLGCQFRLPLSLLGTNRFNIFTGDFDRQLKNETTQFFTDYLGDKYSFNLSAYWHPIKGVDFGGELYIGPASPDQDCHVARSFIMMPYSPTLDIGNVHIEFTRHWINNTLFGDKLGKIPIFENFSGILCDFINQTPPFDSNDNASDAIKEYISDLVDGFLIDGIRNETNATIFPGIINATISYGFKKMKNAISNFTENTVNDFMGEAIGSVDKIFAGLNTSVTNPIAEGITNKINETIQNMLKITLGSVFEAFDALEGSIKENASVLIHGFIDQYIEMFVDSVFDLINKYIVEPVSTIILNVKEQLSLFLSERISINKAEVVLTIWTVRE